MKKISPLTYIELENLKLDFENPRFAELYTGSDNEEDLIEYLLYEEAAEEIAKAIVRSNQFYEDKALWVIKTDDGKFLVGDGNRRCAAVKAIQMPGKYGLSLHKTPFDKLPVYIYEDIDELKARISEEHSASLFRSWERIAKALQILDLANSGKFEEMHLLDSKPGDFVKIGSFYKEAVVHGGEDFKKQLRRGRGKNGGRTIIYERLFKYSKLCGYYFKNKPSYKIDVTDSDKFKDYITALVAYINDHPELTTDYIDHKFSLKDLLPYGFDAYTKTVASSTPPESSYGQAGTPTNPASTSSPESSTTSPTPAISATSPKRGTVKKYPEIKRKQLPSGLFDRIKEYFAIDSVIFPNSKVAMARVTYECVLKYVVENTKSGNIKFSNSGHFGTAYSRKPFTNFEEMNKKFIELILNTGIKQAFNNFDFDKMHQTIHNYHVSSTTIVADQIKNNLLVLLEFLLQDVTDLLNSLDLTKIK